MTDKIGVRLTVGVIVILCSVFFYVMYLWTISMITGDVIGRPGVKSAGNSLCVGEQVQGYCK